MSEVTAPATTAAPAQAHTSMPVPPSTPKAPATETKQAATNVAQPNETPKNASKPATDEYFDVNVDGKPMRMTRDELIRNAALGKGAYKRFEEAAKLRKQAEEFLSRIRNPKDALKLLSDPALGLSEDQVREAIEEYYSEKYIKREQMTPEQRELADAKERIAKFEADEAERKKQLEAQENERLDQDEGRRLQQEIIELIEKSGLPKSRFTTSRIAYWMKVNLSKGINAPPELILEQVKKEASDVMRSLVDSSDGEVLVNLLGESTVKKLRAYDLARLRASRNQSKHSEPEKAPEEKSERKYITVQEFKERLRNWS